MANVLSTVFRDFDISKSDYLEAYLRYIVSTELSSIILIHIKFVTTDIVFNLLIAEAPIAIFNIKPSKIVPVLCVDKCSYISASVLLQRLYLYVNFHFSSKQA